MNPTRPLHRFMPRAVFALAAMCGIAGMLLLAFGLFGLLAALNPRINEMREATIIRLDPHRPYDARQAKILRYPVVEFHDARGVRRERSTRRGALPGYFHVGERVKVAQVLIDWTIYDRPFMAQTQIAQALGGLLLIALVAFYYGRQRRRGAARPHESPPHESNPSPA